MTEWLWKIVLFEMLFATMTSVEASEQCSCSKPLTFATFNTKQIFTAPERSERLQAAIQMLNGDDLDLNVVCLQELWEWNSKHLMINNLARKFPHSYFAPQTTGCSRSRRCKFDNLDQLLLCLDKSKCLDKNFSTLSDAFHCAASHCKAQIANLSAPCQACLNFDEEKNLLDKVDNCLYAGISHSPGDSNCRYIYDGFSDTLLLSSYPLEERDYVILNESKLWPVTVLFSRIDSSLGPVNVFCTHLQAEVPIWSLDDILTAQADHLRRFIDQKMSGRPEEMAVLLGDFNAGPAFGKLESIHLKTYKVLADRAADVLANQKNKDCTFCKKNQLNTQLSIPNTKNTRPDHVFVTGNFSSACLMGADVYVPKAQHISDHYLVRAKLCSGRTNLEAFAIPVHVGDGVTKVPLFALLLLCTLLQL